MLNNRSNNIYMCAYHMCIPDVYMCFIYIYIYIDTICVS